MQCLTHLSLLVRQNWGESNNATYVNRLCSLLLNETSQSEKKERKLKMEHFWETERAAQCKVQARVHFVGLKCMEPVALKINREERKVHINSCRMSKEQTIARNNQNNYLSEFGWFLEVSEFPLLSFAWWRLVAHLSRAKDVLCIMLQILDEENKLLWFADLHHKQ